jgi:predicted O-linked N-acetylglucosamine transferase (SPINDLY family)
VPLVLERAGRLHNAGDLDGAASLYREVLRVQPGQHAASFLLGLIAYQRSLYHEARALLERAVAAASGVARYRLFLGLTLRALELDRAALAELQRARELDPTLYDAWLAEGTLLQALGELDAAVHAFRSAAANQPQAALPHEHMGEVELARARLDQASEHFEIAARLDPALVEPLINLGVICQRRAQLDRARAYFADACRVKADSAAAHFNLGWVEQKLGLLAAAETHYRRALALDPEHSGAIIDLAGVLHELGEVDAALACYRVALERNPDAAHHSSMLSLLQYDQRSTPAALLGEARSWAQRYAPETAARAHDLAAPARAPRLRIGYVSPDFREHAVASFFEPLLAAHDPARFEVTCYSNVKDEDEVTARIAGHARLVRIRGRSDTDVAQQIHEDGIHVLVDLAGHTVDHRLALFALQPAPVQASYLGYPGTTGVAAIRHRFSDLVADPEPGADLAYSEQLVRLPNGFCCFRPPAQAPAVSALPCLARGYVTFGSLNNYTKLSPAVLETWTRLLAGVPDAQLVLQSRPFGDAVIRERVWSRFAALGIARERVQLHGSMPLAAHLALYGQIDIALDTFPWNGHTTTCLALHMGVPVVVLSGERFAGRMGMTLLQRVGLAAWIARDGDDYVAIATRHARARDELAQLRLGLRAQLASSALCDAITFTRSLEVAYERLWSERPAAG